MPPNRTAANSPPVAANQVPFEFGSCGRSRAATVVMLRVEGTVFTELVRVTLVGFRAQVICAVCELGEQVKLTVSANPFTAVIFNVAVPCTPGVTVLDCSSITKSGEGEASAASQAVSRAPASTEPRPVAWS